MYYDFSSSLPSEGVGAELPSFQPPLQAAPEAFEKDLDDIFNLDDQFPTPDDLLHVFPDMIPPSPARAPPTSDYFSTPSPTSNYPPRFDFGSMLDAVDPKRIMFSDPFAFIDSSGPQPSPALLPNGRITAAEAQYDDGPDRPPPVGISPYTLATGFQGPPLPRQMDPPVCATSTKQSRTGPIRTKHICPYPDCGLILTSGRESNLKAHIETHNPNRKKPFVCPEKDCGHPFVRSNDFTRHMQSRHGYQKEAAFAARRRLVTVRRPGKYFEVCPDGFSTELPDIATLL
ncbi:hypothetical protein EDB84DRAFT_1636644 [Lactarius hengduanensis]|nr:hypothetical protein EDB84DRAFT_1636644 [Lactarius hengduanensis]